MLRVLNDEEIEGYVGKPSYKGAHEDVWGYVKRGDFHELALAQFKQDMEGMLEWLSKNLNMRDVGGVNPEWALSDKAWQSLQQLIKEGQDEIQ